ncbi:MAG: hypothetical protein AB3X41_01775 [Leptothrix ochracea]|uniref:hypothetical protein n=1 Tax=Leptothrix ochracea TaxID=735331 RepID=UPI0034E238D4
MDTFPPALSHGALEEVFPDIFVVTGAMQTVLMGAHWHFSRNMTVVRSGQELTLINSVRLDADGLAQLEALGRVTHVLRIGALHGRDDAFYKDRYGATFWALPGMPMPEGLQPDKLISADEGAERPFPDARFVVFQSTKLPESLVLIERAGGILVACDALHNWLAPDAFFSDESRTMMAEMGFFQEANFGLVFLQVSEPKREDYTRLLALDFKHALCGHGSPLRETAKAAYTARCEQVFGR